MDMTTRLHDCLKSLGFQSFRGKQEAAITAALQGRDALVLMPTGGGKSLCYALPAVVLGKLVIVVSPLIALMQDQVSNFNKRGISSDYYCSTRTAKERDILVRRLQSPNLDLRLLFVTPESFGSDQLLSHLQSAYARGKVALVAIDEAHCISSWGHDFRPAYRRLSAIRRELPRLPIMALTATATKQVQDDIVQSVLRNPVRLMSSFNRPNISYHVRYQLQTSASAVSQIAEIIEGMSHESGVDPCCIVYTLKRETADEVACRLNARGVKAAAYHAGLKDAHRSQVLEQWSCGEIPVVAATIAFGMGIDRACVRLVAHLNLPKTLEGFYQESGRAGRDGLPSQSVLFYDEADRERMNWILSKEKGRKRKQAGGSSNGNGPQQDVDRAEQAFAKVVSYCVAERCRRAALLEHFAERLLHPCNGCDWCLKRAHVSEQLAQLAMEGPKRFRERERERRFGSRGYAGFSTGGGAHNGDDDEIESSSEESGEEGKSAACEAASRAAKRARRGGSQKALFQEMENAEKRYEKSTQERNPGSRGELILRKLDKSHSGPVQKPQPGSAAVSAATREAGVQKLLEALRSCPAAGAADTKHLLSAAQAMEQDCYGSSASKAVYLGKLAHRRSEAQKYAAPAELQQWAAKAAPCIPGSEQGASHSGLQAGLPHAAPSQSSAGRAEQHDRDDSTRLLDMCAEVETTLEQTPLTDEARSSVLSRLEQLQSASVDAVMLKETGLGHKIRTFSKQQKSPQVAAAAKAVIVAWKARISH